jgi:hypothetical protein
VLLPPHAIKATLQQASKTPTVVAGAFICPPRSERSSQSPMSTAGHPQQQMPSVAKQPQTGSALPRSGRRHLQRARGTLRSPLLLSSVLRPDEQGEEPDGGVQWCVPDSSR